MDRQLPTVLAPEALCEEDRAALARLPSLLADRGRVDVAIERHRTRNGSVAIVATIGVGRAVGRHTVAASASASAETAGEALCEAARQLGVAL